MSQTKHQINFEETEIGEAFYSIRQKTFIQGKDKIMSDITITTKMARVINNFIGEEIIPKHYIGKRFSQGTKFDGVVEVDDLSGGLAARMIRANGRVSFNTYPKSTQEALPVCEMQRKDVKEIEPEKAALVISALFGFAESKITLTPAQEDQVISLRQAMLPKKTPGLLLKLPIVVLKDKFEGDSFTQK